MSLIISFLLYRKSPLGQPALVELGAFQVALGLLVFLIILAQRLYLNIPVFSIFTTIHSQTPYGRVKKHLGARK
jgi:hypothetical protein